MIAAQMPEMRGAGKMWQRILPGLAETTEIRFVADPDRTPRRWNPDVWLLDGHQGLPSLDAPTVVHLHEAAWNDPDLRPLIEPWFLEEYEEASADAARRATRIITPSRSSRDQIVATSGVAPERIHVVPHGVDPTVFRPGRLRPRDLLARAGYEPERPYVVYVSVIHPRKNLTALKAAMTTLAERGFPHGLVIVGAAPPDRVDPAELERDAVAELPGAPGRIVRLVDLPEDQLAAVISAAEAFCLPSRMEGFGMSALEAMAAGVPVVVSNRGSLPEVVGDAGIIVEPTSTAVTEALATVLSEPGAAHALADAGRQRALKFSWQTATRGWRTAIEAAATS
jgi:glycosyltransferase involved in cell wall biosynthesis